MKPSLPVTPSLPARLRGLRRSTVALVSVAACAVGLLAAPAASANPGGKDLVVFGDSFTANPTVPATSYMAGTGPTSGSRAPVAGANGCPQDRENWSRVAAGIMNVSLADYSCNGTGRIPHVQLTDSVNDAVARGDLGHSTDRVVVMYGGLDAVQWVDAGTHIAGVAGSLPSGFHGTIDVVKQTVQATAPNAELVIAGYPEFAAGDNLCVINLTPDTPAPVTVPGVSLIENGLQSSLRSAAQANGLRFIDMKALTAGHNTCAAPDSQRYIAGFIDRTSDHNMKLHPTLEGSRAMGRIMAGQL